MSDPDMQLLGVVRATAAAVGAVVDESAVVRLVRQDRG
jgi:hypothetical protein